MEACAGRFHFLDFWYRSALDGSRRNVRSKFGSGQPLLGSVFKVYDGKITVVEISTVFGEDPEFWTVAVLGSDQHFMPGDFEIIAPIEPPAAFPIRHAAE